MSEPARTATIEVVQDPTGLGREIGGEITEAAYATGALALWHDIAHFHPEIDETQRMAKVLAQAFFDAITTVLVRRQREAARTGGGTMLGGGEPQL